MDDTGIEKKAQTAKLGYKLNKKYKEPNKKNIKSRWETCAKNYLFNAVYYKCGIIYKKMVIMIKES